MTDRSNRPFLQQSRRDLLISAGAMTLGTKLAASTAVGTAYAQATSPASSKNKNVVKNTPAKTPNFVFIFTDQERYRTKWPSGVELPAHERMEKTGTTFQNHYCPATMCTSSRSVMMTGLTTPNNGMFENCDVPYVGSLSTKIPTIGHMLRKAGYYTAYKGKWHLSKKIDVDEGTKLLNDEMEEYGFADFFSPGDFIGHTLGGYHFDNLVAGSAITWLRRKGRPLADDGKPWSLTVGLVNPHDIMYFNTDLPGEKVQDTGTLMMHAARAPENSFYRASWDVPVPKSLMQPLDSPDRPKAHGEFLMVWDYVLGHIPLEGERWKRFNDYYINCTRDVDHHVNLILQELDALGLSENTVIIFTSDHGEAAGTHGLRGKGPFAYQEAMHLPMYVVHPDVRGGRKCKSLTSHIDLVPTLLSMAGVPEERRSDFAGRELPGKDFSPVFTNPTRAGVHETRDAVLFTYSGLGTNDHEIFKLNAQAKAAGKKPIVELIKAGYAPNMKKRGSLRTVFDGRYKFSRYFAPVDRNDPKTIEQLYSWNDVELFDLQQDPEEMKNLAVDREANSTLIMQMNEKLAAIIKSEIGIDDGREMPNIPFVDWTMDRVDL